MTSRLAIATTSPLSAEAGAEIARAGGNAVDAAIAASLVSINTEPGVCSVGCGGYITVWPPKRPPVTLDGYVATPGQGPPLDAGERNSIEVYLEYGGGVTTVVGPDTVGVAGGIASFGAASGTFGHLPWHTLFEPAIAAARGGFPLPQASYNYLIHSGTLVFGRSAEGFRALHHEDGRLLNVGEMVHVPHLADTLERIARLGPQEMYTGELGREIAAYVRANGGRLADADLAAYRVLHRPSLVLSTGGWQVGTNPAPAVGGTVLAAMLQLMERRPVTHWDKASLDYLIRVQRAVLGYRREHLDLSEDIETDTEQLLELAVRGELGPVLESGATCHTSAVDDSGLACAITMSAGYGAGDMPPGTGVWLNNCLGELELNKRGLDVGPPGTRLTSNMAPTAGLGSDGTVLAIGSPGADRITTAILQTLVNHLHLGMSLPEAVEHPRAHVEFVDDGYRVAYEPDLPVDRLAVPGRPFDGLSMFFGGVSAAAWSPKTGFAVAADPRRTGGVWWFDS